MAQSLINLLITYEKYNYETEEKGISLAINETVNKSLDTGIFSDRVEPVYKEIELMKELVLEFGDAINERIRENLDQTFNTGGSGPNSSV